MHDDLKKELLKKFINNQCTAAELLQVKEIFAQPGAEQLFDDILNERWIDEVKPLEKQQMQALLQEFHHRRSAGAASRPAQEKMLYPRMLKYAAIFIGAVVCFALIMKFAGTDRQKGAQIAWHEIKTPKGSRSTIILPDSSVVYLGSGSRLRYPEHFANGRRDIELEGEALFEVVHHADNPLIVRTGALQTRDIGTTFKITAFKDQPYQVQVSAGEVSVERLQNNKSFVLANLKAGKAVSWDGTVPALTDVVATDVNAWKSGVLVFNSTPLIELTQELERCYDVRIHYEAGAKPSAHVSTVLKITETPVSEVMKALSVSAHFKYSINGKDIWIR